MINILAHRGWWNTTEQKNSIESFKLALENGFGIETDLRDYDGEIVISHDMPTSESVSFEFFMDLVKQYEPQTLALNIKSDGLQSLVSEYLSDYTDYFVFDMSVPDTLGYMNKNIRYYTRYSDIEPIPSLIENAAGVWIDCFSSSELDLVALDEFIDKGKSVVLVSPELHGFEYKKYWNDLSQYLNKKPQALDRIGLCTDFPLKAEAFFSNVK